MTPGPPPGLLGQPYLDPRRQGLLALAGGLMAAGAPTTDPGAGQRLLGQAVTGSLDAYNRAGASAWQNHLLRMQWRQHQIEEAERRRKDAARERYRQGLTGAFDAGDAEGLLPGATRQALSPHERYLLDAAPEKLALRQWEGANAAPTGGKYVNWWNPGTNERRAALQGSPAAAALADGGWLRGDRPADSTALTLAQQKANIEIDTARARILGLAFNLDPGVSLRDEVQRRTQRATDTGRENPDYDLDIAAAWRKATSRKYGKDPDYDTFHAALDRRAPKLRLPVPAPRPEPETPGLLGRVWDGIFGEPSEAAVAPAGAALGAELGGDLPARGGASGPPKPVPRVPSRMEALATELPRRGKPPAIDGVPISQMNEAQLRAISIRPHAELMKLPNEVRKALAKRWDEILGDDD